MYYLRFPLVAVTFFLGWSELVIKSSAPFLSERARDLGYDLASDELSSGEDPRGGKAAAASSRGSGTLSHPRDSEGVRSPPHAAPSPSANLPWQTMRRWLPAGSLCQSRESRGTISASLRDVYQACSGQSYESARTI